MLIRTACRISSLLVALGCVVVTLPGDAFANSVESYPQGVFSIGLGLGTTMATKRFTGSFGPQTESIADDYNVEIRPEDVFGAGTPDNMKGKLLGRTDIQLDAIGFEMDVMLGIGITDELSAMFFLPIKRPHNEVTVAIKDSDFGLTRQNDDAFNGRGSPGMIVPIEWGMADHAMDADDFRDLLTCEPGPGASPMCMFNYDPLKTYEEWGIGDMILGLRYKFHDIGWMRQGLTLFMKFPTKEKWEDNSNDLFDSSLTKGHYDIGFWYGVDFFLFKEFFINATVGYTGALPFQQNIRLASTLTNPATGKVIGKLPIAMYWQQMKVNVDPGDNFDAYLGFTYNFLPYLSWENEFYFYWKYPDNVWGAEKVPVNPDLPAGEAPYYPEWYAQEFATDFSALAMRNAIGFNTLPFVQSGKFPVPLMISAFYSYTIAGKNVEQEHIFGGSLTLLASVQYLMGMDVEIPDPYHEYSSIYDKVKGNKNPLPAKDSELPGEADAEPLQPVPPSETTDLAPVTQEPRQDMAPMALPAPDSVPGQ